MMTVMWDELWIEQEVAADALAAAVGKAHGLGREDVVVVDGIAGEPTRAAAVEVYRTRGGGQFSMRIQLSGIEPDDRRVFCARLASALGCKVLGDDGKINPCTFMMYEPGNAMRVALDPQQLEAQAAVIVGPFDERNEDDDARPTRPVRRITEPTEYRMTRGGQVAEIVLGYMVEGLPRPPAVPWSAEVSEAYANLQRLLGTLAYRKASDEELGSVKAWSGKLRASFADFEKAGWFVLEVLDAAELVLAEPWDPNEPAILR
jgi:hypothetical protein